MGDGYVYVVEADELGNRVKIGWSDNPERRLGELQTGSAYRLKLLAASRTAAVTGLVDGISASFAKLVTVSL